ARVLELTLDERDLDVTRNLLEVLVNLPGRLVQHRVVATQTHRTSVGRASRAELARRGLLGVADRDRFLVDLHHVVDVEPHARFAGRGVRALSALTASGSVPQVVALPLEDHSVGPLPAGQPTNGRQQRSVGRGSSEQLPNIVGQVERSAQPSNSGHETVPLYSLDPGR